MITQSEQKSHASVSVPGEMLGGGHKRLWGEELSLEVMLGDEIVKLMMASDGVSPAELRRLCRIRPLASQGGRGL